MLTKGDSAALIKVLIAAAWADGELAQSEMNYIKALAQRFRFSDQDWDELQPYLDERPSEQEVKALFEDLLDRIGTDGERNRVIRHLERMISADNHITDEEREFLEHYTQLLRQVPASELRRSSATWTSSFRTRSCSSCGAASATAVWTRRWRKFALLPV
jgi:uncharacterized tellurite resistance protein B-like protein